MISFEELCSIVRPIAEKYGVERIILFGSTAREEHTDGSDYDFCVSLGEIDDLVKMCGFIIDLESSLGAPVDVVSERTLDEDFSKEVLNDGKLVYEA
jgi:predicted nucleotidyltransferase